MHFLNIKDPILVLSEFMNLSSYLQDQSFKLVEQHAGTEDLGLETFDCIPQQLPFVVAVSQVVLTDVDAVCAIIISAATPFGEPLVEASLVFEPPIPCAQL